MSLSLFEKTTVVRDRVGNFTLTAANTFRHAIDRSTLTDELKLLCKVTQAYTGVPTSVMPERFIKRITLETSQKIIDLSGMMASRVSEFFDGGSLVKSTLGTTSTCTFSIDLFFTNPQAKLDLLTILDSTNESNFTISIELAPDADNGFRGGTAPLVATMNLEIVNYNLPAMIGTNEIIASKQLFFAEKSKDYTATGVLESMSIEVHNNTRALFICVEDMSGGAFVNYRDDVILNVTLKDGGSVAVNTSFELLQHDNFDERQANMVGLAAIDFGDDEIGFLNLENVQDLRVALEAVSTLPAGVTNYRVTIVQVYMRDKA